VFSDHQGEGEEEMKKRKLWSARKLLLCIGIFAFTTIPADNAIAAFTYDDLVGNTFHVTESNYSYDITFTSTEEGVSTGGVYNYGVGEVFSYKIDDEVIYIPDPNPDKDSTAGISYTLLDASTFSVRQEIFPGPFEVDYNFLGPFFTDYSVFNNNATALKDYLLVNGLWESTITTDGQIIHPSRPTVGEWWIEDNIFHFNYPDSDNVRGVDYKAFKLEDDIPYFQTDAGFTIDSTWEAVPTPIPGAVWLLGSGLTGLICSRVRRKNR
jgi:hypothetical protein